MEFTDSHFALFGLPERFSIAQPELDAAYRRVLGEVHPDRFAAEGEAARRLALQWSTRANEAYRTLRNPVSRASYLCELLGADLEVESNTSMPHEFLMQQMGWREALDDARAGRDRAALERIEAELSAAREDTLSEIRQWLDASPPEAVKAAAAVRRLLFLDRFEEDVEQALDAADGNPA